MPASPIKTVIFDLGGVYFTEGVSHFVRELEKHYGVLKADVMVIVEGDLGTLYRTGQIASEEFWKKCKDQWKIDAPIEEIRQRWFDGYTPMEGTVNLIDRLKSAGYDLLFLSDNAPDRVGYLEEKYHFLHRFRDGIFSQVVKVRKPNPKIYQAALDLAGCPADQCVYFDDKPKQLEPAKTLGMHAYVFESPEQAEADLRTLGLEF